MEKDYIKFILAYDFGDIFESMELACDEAFDLAGEIASRYLEWLKENDDMAYPEYELLHEFCDSISFEEVLKDIPHTEDRKLKCAITGDTCPYKSNAEGCKLCNECKVGNEFLKNYIPLHDDV